MTQTRPALPADFEFGVATASYQIEGAVHEDDRGPSIWDTFSHTPGKVFQGDTGDVACDHYHRYPEDVALMAELGVDSYRLSLAWPRIQPTGKGPANAAGLAFYDRLVDALLERGIAPAVTLYHWDLPQALEDAGGWRVRDTAERFAEYAEIAQEHLGDRVHRWITLNEPFCSSILGYASGRHAPGAQEGHGALAAAHHLLLGHGLAVQRLRPRLAEGDQLGITLNLQPVTPVSDSEADRAAADRALLLSNRLFTDPVLAGSYPELARADVEPGHRLRLPAGRRPRADRGAAGLPRGELLLPEPGPRRRAGRGRRGPSYGGRPGLRGRDQPGRGADRDGVAGRGGRPAPAAALAEGLLPEPAAGLHHRERPRLRRRRGRARRRCWTPTGSATSRDHLGAVAQAAAEGVDVRGFYAWSLMDNFEWAEGYAKRFGIVHVDYETPEADAQVQLRLVPRRHRRAPLVALPPPVHTPGARG